MINSNQLCLLEAKILWSVPWVVSEAVEAKPVSAPAVAGPALGPASELPTLVMLLVSAVLPATHQLPQLLDPNPVIHFCLSKHSFSLLFLSPILPSSHFPLHDSLQQDDSIKTALVYSSDYHESSHSKRISNHSNGFIRIL